MTINLPQKIREQRHNCEVDIKHDVVIPEKRVKRPPTIGGMDVDKFIRKTQIPFPTDKFEENLLLNSMLVRGSGAIGSVETVPAMRTADAVSQMQKAQQMASAMVCEAPLKT